MAKNIMTRGREMYKVKKNEEIGNYLSELIDEKYDSKRKFCVAYLEAEGCPMPDVDTIQRMANRISQICKGNKEIQLKDFPIFTELLGVSCEEILSAGECSAPTMNHLTNYSVAFSRDEKVWEEYVHREDRLILNLDEYGKSVIEYALEFKNFGFLKYLIEKKFIWFADAVIDEEDYFSKYSSGHFDFGTTIDRRLPPEHDEVRWHISYPENSMGIECRYPIDRDGLKYDLAGKDNLRMKMISLAVEHDEVELLDLLRAREIPSLYQASFILCRSADFDRYYDEDMVQCIAEASEQVLNYFSKPIKIIDAAKRKNIFLFPYMSKLIDLLIQKDRGYADYLLKVSIKHNQNTLKKLKELKVKTVNDRICYFEELYRDKEYVKAHWDLVANEIVGEIMRGFRFYENGGIVSYRDTAVAVKDGIITNVIHVDGKSKSEKTNSLIQELNGLYEEICNKKFLSQLGDLYGADKENVGSGC